jgi:vacuolar-type H+-ATPase subunit H
MSAPEGIVQAQMEALLRRVAREQEMLSRRARDAAEEQARNIVERARDEARLRLRQATEEAHQSHERALADRRAALDTSARQREQALLSELMDRAWRVLPAELAAVWADDAARREWCTAACAIAGRIVMGEGKFAVELDPATAEDEARSLARDLGGEGNEAEVRRVDGLGPGLRIRRGLACVDATITGLLASRERVEAELLAEIDTLLAQHGGTTT